MMLTIILITLMVALFIFNLYLEVELKMRWKYFFHVMFILGILAMASVEGMQI